MSHPIHPMLIPYPFAFLSGAAMFGMAAHRSGDEALARTARHLRHAGIVAALAAAVPGLVDYLTTVPEGRPKETATRHMMSNVTALGLFTASAWAGRSAATQTTAMTALDTVGTVLLGIGGWLGGTLSYHHQIGVDPEETPARQRLASAVHEREHAEVTTNVP